MKEWTCCQTGVLAVLLLNDQSVILESLLLYSCGLLANNQMCHDSGYVSHFRCIPK